MSHILLRHFAAQHPRTSRLRKRRERPLRAVRPSRRNELWYRAALTAIVNECRAAGAELANALRPRWPHVADETAPGLSELLQRAAARFGNIAGVAKRLADLAVKKNLGEVDQRLAASILQSVGVNILPALTDHGPIAAAMEDAAQANVDLITSIPAQYLDDVRDVVTEAWSTGARWEDMVADIEERGDVAESRAALIARDQTARLNGSFNEVRQTSLGIEKYTWSTSRDERVRPSHAALEGKVFKWTDPPTDANGDTGHPGQLGVNCRCVALPMFDLDESSRGGKPQEAEAEAA